MGELPFSLEKACSHNAVQMPIVADYATTTYTEDQVDN